MDTTQNTPTAKPFAPSPWRLQQEMDAAMAKFEVDRDQALRRKEAAADRRIERVMLAEAEARRRKALYGI